MVARKPNKPLTHSQIEKLMSSSENYWGEMFPRHSINFLRKEKKRLRKPQEEKRKSEIELITQETCKFVSKNGRMPKMREARQIFSERTLIKHFKGLRGLESFLRNKFSGVFPDAPVEDFSSPKFKRRRLKTNRQKFLLTSAVVGADANSDMLKSIDEYCNRENAEPIILPCAYSAARVSPGGRGYISSELKPYSVLGDELQVNSNLFLSNAELQAAEIDPSTSMKRIGQRDGSFIFASPKQRLVYAPTSNIKWPHAVMTPGACTLPAYQPFEYRSLKRAYIATHDHVMGGVVVDVHDDKTFHFRQIQADEEGGFVDLGKRYSPSGVHKVSCEAMVPGDIHVTETDPAVVQCLNELAEILKPKKCFLHDLFSGISCNHWERDKKITRAQDSAQGKLSLRDEVYALPEFLKSVQSWGDLHVVSSNHHAFLYKYLERAWYVDEPWNKRYALELAILLHDGFDPLAAECERLAPGSATWLPHDRAVDIKVEGVHMSAHGHRGPKGTRGNIKNLEMMFGEVMYGHEHIAQILRGAWCVGTSTPRIVRFNAESPSGWTQTAGLVYKGGHRQLINFINGTWR